MLTEDDWQTIAQAKEAGCEVPALSVYPAEYWLVIAREYLEEEREWREWQKYLKEQGRWEGQTS